ncbi:MAG: thioredoxin family protein [Armatimonadota bacterium]|nr:thioredoxin family protein [Armatimonadota bacterium]MDR7452707.1 thioredoxin family protein [Armatimonadota bacterium]MDR7467312.1 thioredoxin family protein [Armatimonadota bacterium]MDR7494573.1 thioredoxin family protein [Armatimonadota bacterium]MDR7500560.1 thioredoxin family protein [Armatimonadota bacterium]
MEVEFLYWEECPSHEEALARLRAVLTEEGMAASVRVIRVETDEQARALGFPGSPSIRVNGEDLFPTAGTPVGLSCRVYVTDEGRVSPLPTKEMIRTQLRRRVAGS